MRKKTTLSEFIEKSNKTHGNKYDYSKSNYINAKTKLIIICKKHGEFEQLPSNHDRGYGCPMCIYNKLNSEDVIKQFKMIHGDKYDYSKILYIGDNINVDISCKTHGIFKQSPSNHKSGKGCPKCCGRNLDIKEIINIFNKIHENKYDYSKIGHINGISKITIICPEHGEFKQTPSNHKQGSGCGKCAGNKKLELHDILDKFRKIHGNKYNYSKVKYINAHRKITISCHEHGDFNQTPNNHKNGNGCPMCNESNGESKIRVFLEENNIDYHNQYKFNDCKNILPLIFDFYLPASNMCIEFNGLQHYRKIDYFGGASGFIRRKNNDKIKKEYCGSHNIPLVIIKYNDDCILKLKGSIFT